MLDTQPFGCFAEILQTILFRRLSTLGKSSILCWSPIQTELSKGLSIVFQVKIKDARVLTKDVKIVQSEGISGSGIPEQAFVKNVHRRSFLRSPHSPLLFFACHSLRYAPLSERLEKANRNSKWISVDCRVTVDWVPPWGGGTQYIVRWARSAAWPVKPWPCLSQKLFLLCSRTRDKLKKSIFFATKSANQH